jgi:DNA ligase (NAD+)
MATRKSSSTSDIHGRIEELRRQVRHHDHLYFVEGRQEISDLEYDRLLKELLDLEAAHPEFASADSPTQRVGGAPIASFRTVTHRLPMLSIGKATTAEEVQKFDERLRSLLPGEKLRYVVEPKIDGVAISLTYVNGVFDVGVTRGDGERGDDVTHILKTVRGVPMRLSTAKPPPLFEVRGEVYMTKADFATLNEQNKSAGKKTYENPRNLTAGTMHLLDPTEAADRRLRLSAYSVGAHDGVELDTHEQVLNILREFGFPVNKQIEAFDSIAEVVAYCKKWDELRNSLPFEIDGLVIKINDLGQRDQLGSTARDIRWALAYKFQTEQGISKVLNIELSIGKYGELTPVAIIEPVRLCGTTVQRVSLHNAALMAEKDIRVGDQVVVVKRGDIIPHIEESLKDSRTGAEKPFKFPSACPECGSPVVQGETGKQATDRNFYCTGGLACPGQVRKRLNTFAKRERMDVAGLGEETCDALVQAGLVRTLPDLYRLTPAQLKTVPALAGKAGSNLLQGIADSKNRGLARLLSALGIYGVSETMAPNLTREFPTIDLLLAASKEDLAKVEGFGPTRAASVYNFFHSHAGEKLVHDFRELGLKLTEDVAPRAGPGPLTGLTVVVTGKLEKYLRSDIEARIADLGGTVGSSVSKKTNLLVVGADAGSKLDKAVALGVKTITEADFEKMVLERAAAMPTAPAAKPATPPSEGPLSGMTFVVTGELDKYDRKEAERLIVSRGGKTASSVTKAVTHVLAGDAAGAKLDQARELKLPILTEAEFEKLLSRPT